MKSFCLWLQRLYILGFLLFAWYIGPFTHFTPIFPEAWSLVVAAAAYVLPLQTCGVKAPTPGWLALRGVLVGALVGLTIGAADWAVRDVTLLFELCWVLMPLFLFGFAGPPSSPHR